MSGNAPEPQARGPRGSEAGKAGGPRARTAHYVLSSHWDREWHEPFEVFRRRLVTLLDSVLDAVAADRLGGPFTCDGQAVLLEDYLAVRPERAGEVRAALASGALVAGPWYAPPDLLIPSGEALVRNLRLGRQLVRGLGGTPSDAGFLGDLFGHNSQVPQLLRGFGIRGGFLWRGVNLSSERHLVWTGADGTRLPCYRFGTNGYWGFAVHVGGFTSAAPVEEVVEGLGERLQAYIEAEAEATEIGPVLLFDGPDHRQLVGPIQDEVRRCLGRLDGWDARGSSLDAYQAEMLEEAEKIGVEVRGELLTPARFGLDRDQQWLIAGTLSSRIPAKQANAAAQAWLCHAAEPWSAVLGRATGRQDPPGLLDHAWAELLKNHAHDSICGCSTDAVHEDVDGRFRRAQQVAGTLAGDAWRTLARRADLPPEPPEARRLLLVNPVPRDRPAAVTEATVDVPADWPTATRFNFDPEPLAHFDLIDEAGEPVPFQRLEQTLGVVHVERLAGRNPRRTRAHRVRLAVEADLPAAGHRTLRVVPRSPDEPIRGRPRRRGLRLDDRSMQNERLRVVFDANGSFTLTDLASGEAYPRQLTFEDAGDVGDGWNFEAPANQSVQSSAVGDASLCLLHDGPLQTTFRVRTRLAAPAAFDRGTQRRAEEERPLVIDTEVTLRRGDDAVHLHTRVDHHHEDHRLRVLFPTGAPADRFWADTPFDVVERAVGLSEDADAYREDPVEERPQQSWTAASDETRGLAVVAAGLPEAAVLDRADRPVALTLFRATRRTVFTNGEPGGQLRRPLSFRYAVCPLRGNFPRAALCELGTRLNLLTPESITASPIECLLEAGEPRLPARASAVAVEGPTVLTSFRAVGDAVEARLFNPEERNVEAVLRFPGRIGDWVAPATAVRVDLEGHPLPGASAEPIEGDRFGFGLKPKEIVSLRLEWTNRSP